MTNSVGVHWERLPEEMRWTPNWCVAGPDKAPYSANVKGLYRASVIKGSQWLDFETASEAAIINSAHIGYVLSENDPFTCIDLDVCDEASQTAKGEPIDPALWTTQEQLNRYWSIVQMFDSYTELSRSGKGLHIWVRGKIGKGRKRDGVEVYSQERFIICTGNIVVNKGIAEQQELLNVLVSEMHVEDDVIDLIELEQAESDDTIWQRASTANNDHKFIPLCEGKWVELGYESQSEADLALLSMFTFYSKSNSQCRRLFRQTMLGKREKAVKNNIYLDRTLKRIRTRQEGDQRAQEHGQSLAATLLAKDRSEAHSVSALVNRMQNVAHAQVQREANIAQPAPPAIAIAQMIALPVVNDDGLDWPPGFCGALAGFVYQSAIRPVKEVAIVAALGLLAGICGKAFAIPQSGLNLYIILVGRSAIGKEAMHSGLSALMEATRQRVPMASNFVDFNEFASGPALSKAVAVNPSFVNVAGEWGKKLKRLANDMGHDGPMQSLRTVMTNLYQKSGPSSVVGGISYSDKDKNIGSVSGVAYSMIGETTPDTLYESLTESMMSDGFLSRFTIIEYHGKRPEENEHPLTMPDKALGDALANLCNHAITLLSRNQRQDVGRDVHAAAMLKSFSLHCDAQINATDDESHRQMWNRAALKITRIAALLAVADNYTHPVIQQHHVEWAISVVKKDIEAMLRRMSAGDVGANDESRHQKLISLCQDYRLQGASESYDIPLALQQDGIIPRKYLQIRSSRQAAFNNHRLGSVSALDITLRSLVDSGYLLEVPKIQQVDKYKYHGKCYQIIGKVNNYKK